MCPFTDVSLSLADPRNPILAAELNHKIQQYRSQHFAKSTKATYRTHRNTYLRFCNYMGYTPVPLHPAHLLHYAAFLARSLKPSSISGYLNIIGILHKEFGLPTPLLDNNNLIGYPCLLRNTTHQSRSPNVTSSFSPGERSSLFDGAKLFSSGKGRLKFPFPASRGGSYALLEPFSMPFIFLLPLQPIAKPFPLSTKPCIFTYNMFISKLRDHLSSIGINPQSYAGHSFRRGGASFAYQSVVPRSRHLA